MWPRQGDAQRNDVKQADWPGETHHGGDRAGGREPNALASTAGWPVSQGVSTRRTNGWGYDSTYNTFSKASSFEEFYGIDQPTRSFYLL